ncbi:YfgM family protein [Aliikangiella sp. IMCC44359]|uniref:YfgM family protein n=1 Tax=Aliikangiella sp. IMCC44359 TaxID=3459125 RepID=UPI00403AD3F1
MSYDTEEQQVEKLKEWWSENGTPLIIGAVIGLAGFAGWKYWTEKEVAHQAAASDLYMKVTEVLKSEDKTGLAESAKAVKSQYPKTSYAILSSFQLAKLAVDANELSKAAAELTWIIDNHPDNELTPVAKIRLARIFIQQDKAADALPLVKVDKESGYSALASLVEGDALLALDKKDQALAAYKIAMADVDMVAKHPSLQFKIDQLSASEGISIASSSITSEKEDSNKATETPAEEKAVAEKNSEETAIKEKPASEEQSTEENK